MRTYKSKEYNEWTVYHSGLALALPVWRTRPTQDALHHRPTIRAPTTTPPFSLPRAEGAVLRPWVQDLSLKWFIQQILLPNRGKARYKDALAAPVINDPST
jgi:hypothetical protein